MTGPTNNENMDAMRDMISARELRDRSIEEGWEIIDARWWTTAGSPAKTKARRPKRPKPTIPRTRPTR